MEAKRYTNKEIHDIGKLIDEFKENDSATAMFLAKEALRRGIIKDRSANALSYKFLGMMNGEDTKAVDEYTRQKYEFLLTAILSNAFAKDNDGFMYLDFVSIKKALEQLEPVKYAGKLKELGCQK